MLYKHLKEYKHKLMAKLCMTLGVRVGSVLEMRAEPMRPAISFQYKNNRVVGVIDFYKNEKVVKHLENISLMMILLKNFRHI